MFNRILVPLDGSTLAERAIPHAEQFARIFGSNIVLLQILDPTSSHENPDPVDPLTWQIRKAEADMYMNGIAEKIRRGLSETSVDSNAQAQGADAKKSRVEYAIREGKTAENIVNFAHTEDIDLLIISTHGSGGLSRWNISSITQKVINLIYLPVLIVRAYNAPEIEGGKIHYRRILLPIDSSRRAECSLSAGIALTRGESTIGLATDISSHTVDQNLAPAETFIQTELILAAVIKSAEIPIPEPYPNEIKLLSDQLMQVSRQAVSNYLNEMRERLSVNCSICVVENNSVSSAIQEMAANEENIDLVVLCAHGYTGQSTWPYGNVARNYIEYGTKPVLVIQDVPRSRVLPTAAELASDNSGGR